MKGRLSVVKRQSPFTRVTQRAKAGLLAVIWISIAAFSVGAQAEVLLYPVSERVYSPDLYISGLSDQPNEAIDIELNNSTVVQTRSNATGEFTVIVALTAGDNRIRALSAISADSSEFQSIQYVPVRDKGQTGAQRKVRNDIGAPVLDAINAQSDTNPATLTGSAAPGSTVSFFVNGRLTRSIVVDESGVFSAWVPLQDGDNSIYAISATDAWQTVASNSVASSYTNTLEREWSGDISNTLVWTKGDGSPYILEGDLNVLENVTLWIQPGVEILVNGNYRMSVSGYFKVTGLIENPVLFKPTAADCNGINSSRSDWPGIEVVAGASAALEHAEVHCAQNGIHFNGGDGSVRNSEFLNNTHGIRTAGASAEARIAPEIAGNTIRGSWSAVVILLNSDPQISGGNEITLNGHGLVVIGDGSAANNPQPVATGNNLYGNTHYNFYTSDFGDPTSTTLDATGNWWGSTEPGVIASSIYDRNDSPSSPLVNYGSYLDSLNGQPVYTGHSLSGSIDEDTVLPAGRHLLLENSVVEPGVTLTLEAGASLLAGPDLKLQVTGTLVAQGTADSEVVFAPLSGTTTAGQWYGIEVIAGGSVDFNYARVEGARFGLEFNGGQGTVRNSLFRRNSYGIYVRAGSNPLISSGNEITLNSFGLLAIGDGSAANNPQPVVTGNNLYGNWQYDFYTSDFGDPENTTLDATGNWWGSTELRVIASSIYDRNDDSSSPLVNYGSYLDSFNGQPAGFFLSGSIDEDTVLPAGQHLLLESSMVEPGVTLTLEAGASLLADPDLKLQVAGTLLARGTADSEVVFAPLSGTSDRGQWYGIEVIAGGSVDLDYARVEGAQYGLEFNGGQGTVRNSLFRFNFYGIWVRAGSNPLISAGNEITSNSYGLLVVGDGSAANNPQPVVTGNNLYGNTQYDFYTGSFGDPENTTLNATGNWWGSTELGAIASSIYDRNDDSSSPLVNYGSYLDSLNGQPAGLFLSGSIDEDIVLPAGRHLLLESSVVESGVTLTLEAGASLLASADQKLQVAGTLLARGTADSEVVFAPLPGTSTPGQWCGIEVIAGGNVDFNYARVEGAQFGLEFNGGQGIVRNSLFRFNTVGIYVRAGSNPLIGDGNEITLNAYGLFVIGDGSAANNPQPVVTGNNLYGNTEYDFYTSNFGDPENTTLDATGNWWGTVDEAVIETQIYTAASTSPQVDFSNYWVGAFGRTVVRLTVAKFYPLEGEQALGSFTLSSAANVTIEIRRDVDNTLVYQADGSYPQAGEYPIFWNGRDNESALQAEGLYYVMLRVNNGLDNFVYNVPHPGGEGSVSGSVPGNYNAYANDFYKISVNVASPSLVSMQVTPDGESAFYVFEDVFYSKGQHWLYWDGRDPSGRIVESPVSIYYPAPKPLRSTAIYLADSAPRISGAAAAPSIEVKSDPYLVSHSYEQLTRMAYRISSDAYVTFSLLPPGIVNPQDPSAIVLVDDVLQQAQDGSGGPVQHEVEWRGYDLADPNAVLVGEEGAYTFAIQATSPQGGESALYRGVVNLYR
ncbi:right-handed parallel beta-helix repeat-containing protein [Microbulbifer sp. 2201CG32-9]|uniref:right-handed parallel beta-helix repeat-containing protein n=1 Tax=Microbulbifer sp. 2201CG32-9 TaxID=3232309 RepID=UPI00345BF81D